MENENDLESEKSPGECMRYLLKKEISTDVTIEVGPPDGETVMFRAHKCILMSRSEVFEAMFSSGMAECRNGTMAKVRIEDVDADAFKQLLNYMYYEAISICPKSAVRLLYAAKKYMLPKLVRDCCKCLFESLCVDNVIQFLDHSLPFDEQQLEKACLKLICMNAVAVLTGAEILSASRLTMKAILEAKTIPVDESLIFETAISWAVYQFQSAKPGEFPTDMQVREVLGDLLYKIRFPIMKPVEFAAISARSNVLTAEEKGSIYYFLVTGKIACQMKFPIEKRILEDICVDRTGSVGPSEWLSTPYADGINFETDQDILLTGIGLYMGYEKKGYDVDVEILESTSRMFSKTYTIPHSGESTPYKILFDVPMVIRAGVVYTVKGLADDTIGYYGESCNEVCTKETVKFTFSKYPESLLTTSSRGQIPRLYFCVL